MEAFVEDSDSNDESNWRNEYPDDDEEEVLSDDYDEFGFCASGNNLGINNWSLNLKLERIQMFFYYLNFPEYLANN